jgi:cytochrome oxidase assembly protein ShyY1
LRSLLTPSWLALLLGVLLFAGACFWLLSPWQFGRNAEREADNAAITRALHQPPVGLARLLPGDMAPTQDLRWREVTATGRFLPRDEALARLRSVESDPAYEVLTPFRTDSGQTLLVDRGYVRPVDNGVPGYPAAPTNQVSITARVQTDEVDPQHRPSLVEDGKRQLYAINSAQLGRDTGRQIRPGYFSLDPGQPGALSVAPLPELDSGPFLSYALQWIVFGVMAIGGLGYFTWRELKPGGALSAQARERRREDRVPKRGRRAVAARVAEEEAAEQAERDRSYMS